MNKEKMFRIIKNIVAIVVMMAMFVIIFYQNRDRDIFKFGKNESSSVITPSQDTPGAYSGGDVLRMEDSVAYITTTSLNILDENAKGTTVKMALAEPIMHVEENYAVCYNNNSLQATVFKYDSEYYSIRTENKIMRAKVNRNGYLFVATEKDGYNCECLVFNRSGEAIFKWDISKSEFIDGDINCSNNSIVISLAAAGDQKLLGEIVLIDITNAKVLQKTSIESGLYYKVDFNRNDTYTALGSGCLSYFNADGTQKWSYDFKGQRLVDADVSNPDMMVVAFEKSTSGIKADSTNVFVINRLGKVLAKTTFENIIDDISVSESAIALAFGKDIYICGSDLKTKKTIQSEASIMKTALFNDNNHVFVIGASGSKILK